MNKKTENFSMEDARRLAASPAGKELISLLQNTDSAQLQTAAQQAAAGNMEDAKKSLAPLLNSPQIRALLKQLGGSNNG